MSRRRLRGVALLLTGLALGLQSACAGSGAGTVAIVAQRAHAQCPVTGTEARTLWLRQAGQWSAAIGADEASAVGRSIDWSREQVVLQALAQQPTTGHSIAPAADSGSVEDGVLKLSMRIRRPAPDAMVGMAFTRPCVLLVLPSGSWREVLLIDADGGRELGRAR